MKREPPVWDDVRPCAECVLARLNELVPGEWDIETVCSVISAFEPNPVMEGLHALADESVAPTREALTSYLLMWRESAVETLRKNVPIIVQRRRTPSSSRRPAPRVVPFNRPRRPR